MAASKAKARQECDEAGNRRESKEKLRVWLHRPCALTFIGGMCKDLFALLFRMQVASARKGIGDIFYGRPASHEQTPRSLQ
jgi:hypothetical protein